MNKFIAGIYIRLSKEDEIKNDNSSYSESVENQKELLLNYVKENNFVLYDTYIDDGYSGTNFNRPSFNRLISDIENNKVNVVIVKDLSRLGRDYILTGYYLEMWFPKKNIRFISILDNIDTFSNNNINFDFAPFKTLINDMYSRDNSKKIKTALRTKQLQGKWVGGCTPFGYIQDEKDKNHLVINNEEADIVKKIYSLFLRGYSINKISDYLYKEKILPPNIQRDINRKNNNFHWSSTTIKTILTNRLYTGDMIQNRRSRINYKVRTLKKNNKEDWIVVLNTHKAIIDKDDFDDVQRIISTNSNIKSNKKNDYLLSGFLYCGECKNRIVIQKSGEYFYTMCNNYRKNSKLKVCTPHSNNYFKLEKTIIDNLKKIISTLDIEKVVDRFDEKVNQKNSLEDINSLKSNLDSIYLDYINKKIKEDMYLRISERLTKKIEQLENKKVEKYNTREYVESYLNNISKDVLIRLIKKIEIHKDKSIDIYFNFIAQK